MKNPPYSLERLAPSKKLAPAKKAAAKPKRKHWTDEFFKHVDAWGNELRKAQRKAGT